jgi:ATP-dependent RNA helicase SUPV3L1/SUV3
VERLLAHGTGAIGLPLRLLAREVYDRMVRQKGERACALITGEERIRPEHARYFACTAEAMPPAFGPNDPFDFVAIDEIQLASDPDRGHVFTDRILHARGRHETMLLGADTMRPALQALDLDVDAERRDRFSQLSYAGPIKITKLPKRSAVVAFSAEEVYAIAELLKRQRGGCAVIMGALSPRTRNAQVALYQSGEVDYIVATDAIGMGLNLDVQHIAFASRGKFDGRRRRLLRADEAAQIAGRAGRFRDDGTFGETADCEPFDEETIDRIINHRFEPTGTLNWRNSNLDWSSLDALLASLRQPAPHVILRRAPEALDETTLAALAEDQDIRRAMRTSGHVRRLWDLCTLPDFRKSGADAHLKLVGAFVEKLIEPAARIKDEWMYEQVHRLDRTEGDLDVLQQRLAAIRTWTYAANRADWLENAETWRGRTREIEDKLSDALHERLMQRFVDRRTSALLKTLNSEEDAPAEVSADGRVLVGGHDIGRLDGLSFVPDATGQTLEGRALRNAALKGLRPVISQRLLAIANAEDAALSLNHAEGVLLHDGAAVAKLKPGSNWLSPGVELIGAPDASSAEREAAVARLTDWLAAETTRLLKPLHDLRTALTGSTLPGPARGAAYQLSEAGAVLDRRHGDPLGPHDRAALQAVGVKSGRIAAWLPGLLKPAAAQLAMTLRSVHSGIPARPTPSSASFALKGQAWPEAMLHAAGYLRLGPRAVRADMAERLSWLLGQARRGSETSAFVAPPELAAQIGCPIGEFPDVLRALGLKPAERDPATNAVTRWRFASQKTAQRRDDRKRETATATGPFAALAALTTPQSTPPPTAPRKRRRHRAKPPQPKSALP